MSITCVSLKRNCLKEGEKTDVLDTTAFVLWSPNVAAQETLAVGACMADAKSLCGATGGTGVEPLRGCFRDLSGKCLLSLAKLLEVDEACRAHVNQQSANVQIGEGRLEAAGELLLIP